MYEQNENCILCDILIVVLYKRYGTFNIEKKSAINAVLQSEANITAPKA